MNRVLGRIASLPALERYGGDTTPVEVALLKPDGRVVPLSELTGATYKLNIVAADNFAVGSAVTITGSASTETSTGGAVVSFPFTASGTVGHHGKFVYQIDIMKDTERRVGQGDMLIIENIAGGADE